MTPIQLRYKRLKFVPSEKDYASIISQIWVTMWGFFVCLSVCLFYFVLLFLEMLQDLPVDPKSLPPSSQPSTGLAKPYPQQNCSCSDNGVSLFVIIIPRTYQSRDLWKSGLFGNGLPRSVPSKIFQKLSSGAKKLSLTPCSASLSIKGHSSTTA